MAVDISPTTRCYLLYFLFVAREHSPEKTKMNFSVQAVAKATKVPRSGASAVAASTVRPVCKRARHEIGDDESSNEPGLVTKLARYHQDHSDDESFSHTTSDASMGGDGSISDGTMSLDQAMDVDAPQGEKRKHTSTTSHMVGSRKRRGIVDPMDVEYIPREVKRLTSDCALNGRYWTDFGDEMQCLDLSGMELEVPYCTRWARKRSNERSRRTLNLNFDSEEELGDDERSVMSDLTTNSNVHTGADTSNPEFDGLDVQAVDALAEILQRLNLSDNAMEIDDDDASLLFNDYIARSVLVIPQSRRVYYTRAVTTAIRRWERDRRQGERNDIWAA